MVQLSIPKNVVSSFNRILFDGKIVVVDTFEKCDDAIRNLKKYDKLGIDTETRPSFKKGVVHKMALLQVSAYDVCYLFRINKLGLTDSVKSLLEDATIKKIGLSLKDDMRKISEVNIVKPANFVDLQDFVKKYGIVDNGLQRIFGIVFNRYISKGQQLTNWEADQLSINQQEYAATDAWACLKVYDELINNRFEPEKSIYKVVEHPEQDTGL